MLSFVDIQWFHGRYSSSMYADDTHQVCGFCRLFAATALAANITDCVEAATSWMRSNRLQPNPDKTEFLWCSTVRQHQMPTSPLLTDGCSITPVQSARDLSIYIDCVQRTVFRCFAVLRQLYSRSVAPYRQPHFRS